ncbi:Detected protein of unknown function [Hibiscus syriacus]|uniref:Uncharacterized protein n=1 Tax=Hibiscus syriacus TaxID=106335 RepID=A0A6A2ZNL8_HIBSY|nr:Detected protein of unknown function [Hibiscus syriacus]
MGCATSKKEEEDGVVSLCKERKRLLKLAVERRYALAEAQCKYNQSLYAVAAAIRLFVARHSSPSSPFLITFPATTSTDEAAETPITNPWNQDQGHDEVPRTEEGKEGCVESSEEQEGEEEKKISFASISMAKRLHRQCHHQRRSLPGISSTLLMSEREEGIPDLEEDGVRVMSERKVENVTNADEASEKNSFRMIKTPTATNERELLEALKDVEDHFLRAYESGLDVCRMLEANRVQLQSGLEELKVVLVSSSCKLTTKGEIARINLSGQLLGAGLRYPGLLPAKALFHVVPEVLLHGQN